MPYLIRKENMNCYGRKSAEFLAKVPSGLLPVILLDGKLITESIDIMFVLEETFQSPYKKMIPTDDNDKMQAFHRYMRLERVLVGAWLSALRSSSTQYSMATHPIQQALTMLEKALVEFDGVFLLGDEPSFIDIFFCTCNLSPLWTSVPSCISRRVSLTCGMFGAILL